MSSRSSARSHLAGRRCLQRPIIALRPQMVARGGINQLGIDPHLLVRFLYAPSKIYRTPNSLLTSCTFTALPL
jgi:hypothetical protein